VSTRGKDLLQFLAPGFLHQLRNALFAIQGQAQLLGSSTAASAPAKQRTQILAATKRAQAAIQVLRYLSEDGGAVQAGILLPRLVDVLRVPMRERGLVVSCQHSSREAPVRVNGTLLSETVVGALKAIAERLPTGFGGSIRVDLCAQGQDKVEIVLELVAVSGQLPFQVDLLAVQQELQAAISPHGGLVVLVGRKLALHLPAAPAAAAPAAPRGWGERRGRVGEGTLGERTLEEGASGGM
jgi:signal transduction histidine kinase